MNIVEIFTFVVGKYTVIQRPRLDSPGWGQYCVYVEGILIGKSFSMPNEDACQWLERQQREQTFYAYSSAKLPELSRNENGRRRSVGDARRTAIARAARTRRVAGE